MLPGRQSFQHATTVFFLFSCYSPQSYVDGLSGAHLTNVPMLNLEANTFQFRCKSSCSKYLYPSGGWASLWWRSNPSSASPRSMPTIESRFRMRDLFREFKSSRCCVIARLFLTLPEVWWRIKTTSIWRIQALWQWHTTIGIMTIDLRLR